MKLKAQDTLKKWADKLQLTISFPPRPYNYTNAFRGFLRKWESRRAQAIRNAKPVSQNR
jgi:hypothetical protein